MTRILAIVGCALLVGACGTTYKPAPSTTKISTNLATAKRSTQEASKRSQEIEKKTETTHAAATSTQASIDAALKALDAKDYTAAGKHLIDAKVNNAIVMTFLEQTVLDLASMRQNFDVVAQDLNTTETEFEAYKKKVEDAMAKAAKNQAIVDEGEWGWGLGYIVIGIKRILSHAFWGSLILIGAVIVIVILAKIIGGPFLAGVTWVGGWLWDLWKNRSSKSRIDNIKHRTIGEDG